MAGPMISGLRSRRVLAAGPLVHLGRAGPAPASSCEEVQHARSAGCNIVQPECRSRGRVREWRYEVEAIDGSGIHRRPAPTLDECGSGIHRRPAPTLWTNARAEAVRGSLLEMRRRRPSID
eukprot:3137659-Prymnesium_polylepis.1